MMGLKEKKVGWLICCILFVVNCFFSVAGYGMGLEVDPGEIIIKNCPLGRKTAVSDLGGQQMKLSIKNKGASTYTYVIGILSTTETTAPLKEGYKDIPDISWIQPENKEVEIAGNSTKTVELYLNIPKKAEYYNKNYQAVIEVKSKKNSSEEIFVLACQLKIWFSTVSGEEER